MRYNLAMFADELALRSFAWRSLICAPSLLGILCNPQPYRRIFWVYTHTYRW